MLDKHIVVLDNILRQLDEEISNHRKVVDSYINEIVDILIAESDTYLDAGLMLTQYNISNSIKSLVFSKVQQELTNRSLRGKIQK
ncbi:hypothetical protein [Metaclostridioides mangenotii]|uniref:hypothetical protein n=1 Tax=Metaclostridioides mangenotii TaxID=1540 RepID=UPI0026EA76A1|nr:hypothetical protein [Clostridioides mangenotii]